MTNHTDRSAIDSDTMVANLLHQIEAAVVIDEESLAQRKQHLLAWMEDEPDRAERPAPETAVRGDGPVEQSQPDSYPPSLDERPWSGGQYQG
ncbi:hypothetical protein ACFWAX_16275, partial [Streptomyces sp. NPDC059956]|uniref:hypothetical protein n=1 Tax=Streptomyces sp. NPDC059956 TaxID=3347015 RepID=UPI00364CFB4B